MTLVKTGVLNAIAVLIRVLSSVALNKIIAIFVGPSGYAVIGQFQNLVTMLVTLANGGMNNGITKGTAEHFDDIGRQHRIWQTAGTITIVGASIAGLGIVLFREPIARYVLNDARYANVFIWLGLGLVLIAVNGLLLAILNGKKQIKLFVVINIIGSLLGLAITGILTILLKLEGALIALSINQALVLVVSAILCHRQPWFRLSMLLGSIDPTVVRELLKFAAMALASATVTPLTQIAIRNDLIAQFGMNSAGYWEALTRISALYLTIITVPLSIYYLPRFAEIRRHEDLVEEIVKGLRIIAPATIVIALLLYMLRDVAIYLLFTKEFIPMRNLFGWQAVGDVFKVMGWLLGYVLIGRGFAKSFIVIEISFGFLWYFLVTICTSLFGLVGAQVAYAANYMIYTLVLVFLLKFNLKRWNQHESHAARGV